MIYDKFTPPPHPSKGEWEPGNGPLRTLTNSRFINFQLYDNEMYLGLLHNNTFVKFEFINDVICHLMEGYADFNLFLSGYIENEHKDMCVF